MFLRKGRPIMVDQMLEKYEDLILKVIFKKDIDDFK